MYQEGRLERCKRFVIQRRRCIEERGSGADVKSLKRKPDLISHLQRLGLDTVGTIPTLKDRVIEHFASNCQQNTTIRRGSSSTSAIYLSHQQFVLPVKMFFCAVIMRREPSSKSR